MSLSPEMIAALAKQVERYSSEPTPLSEYLDENHEAGGTNGEMLLSYRDDIEVSLDTIADAIRLKDEEEQAQVIDRELEHLKVMIVGMEDLLKGFRCKNP